MSLVQEVSRERNKSSSLISLRRSRDGRKKDSRHVFMIKITLSMSEGPTRREEDKEFRRS